VAGPLAAIRARVGQNRTSAARLAIAAGPMRAECGAGDPAVLVVAGSQKIERELEWRPQFPSLDVMVKSAWTWKQTFPLGYEKGVGRQRANPLAVPADGRQAPPVVQPPGSPDV
jgi:hypothetical protein